MIERYSWPGNVRELKHQVSRAMLLCHDGHITDADLALPMHQTTQSAAPSVNSQTKLDEVEKTILVQALAEAKNNVSEAARKLGITRMTMRYRMDKHRIKH